ncbi:hypothetical protein N2152v2_004090 [Parachlorella kessleri]
MACGGRLLQFHHGSETAGPVDASHLAYNGNSSSPAVMERSLAYLTGRLVLADGALQQGMKRYTPFVDLRQLADSTISIYEDLGSNLKLAYEQEDERLVTEVQVALMGVADIYLAVRKLAVSFRRSVWGSDVLQFVAERTVQQLDVSLPVLDVKLKELDEVMADPEVPGADRLLYLTALRCIIDEVAWSIGPDLAQYLGGLTLGTVFATGALRLLGNILDPENVVMPLQAQALHSMKGLADLDYVKHLTMLRCGEHLERLLARPFLGRIAHLHKDLKATDQLEGLSPVMEAAQRSNTVKHGMLRYLRKQVLTKFVALPLEEQAEPQTVPAYMLKALERISTPGRSVEDAVRNVRELVTVYHALRGQHGAHGLLRELVASGATPRDAPPSAQLESVNQALHRSLDGLFTEEHFTKLSNILCIIMRIRSRVHDALLLQLFEGAINPLLGFLETLLCDGFLTSTRCADHIRAVVAVGQHHALVLARAVNTAVVGKEPPLRQQDTEACVRARAEAEQTKAAVAEVAKQVERDMVRALGASGRSGMVELEEKRTERAKDAWRGGADVNLSEAMRSAKKFYYEREAAGPVDAFQVAFSDHSSGLMLERKLAYLVARQQLSDGEEQLDMELYTPVFST